MEKSNGVYATKDFYSACLLRASGFSFERIEQGEGKFSLFVFSDPQSKAEGEIKRYWARNFQIEAKDLVDAIHDMKSILYSNH